MLCKGKSTILKVSGTSKRIKKYAWKVKGKAVKIISKRKNTVKIKAVKTGKSVIRIKINGKTLKCIVKVKSAKKTTGKTPSVVPPEKPVQPKPGQDIQQPEIKPEVIQPGNSEETEPGENDENVTFQYTRNVGSNNIYFYDNFIIFTPGFLSMIFSDEESKTWIEKLSSYEKSFMIEAINNSDNSSELKESLIAIINNPDILVQEEGIRAELKKKINTEGSNHGYELGMLNFPSNDGRFDVVYKAAWYTIPKSEYAKIMDERGEFKGTESEFLELMEKINIHK
ncbi:hypothetical protein AALA00_06110 [Lachnospiraceae bacterium 46-15]